MSGFFNFLKNLFSGILSFFSKGSSSQESKATGSESKPTARKSKGYFLELDDAKGVGTAPSSAPAKAAEPETAPQAVAVEAAPAAKPAAKADPQPAPKAEPVAAAAAEPAKVEPAATANALNLPQPTVTFAPTYLGTTSSSNGRRRPGANMAAYLNMARQVKAPS